MKAFILSNDRQIQVSEENGGYRISFFEHYESCGWRLLSTDSDLYSKESLEFEYGIKI